MNKLTKEHEQKLTALRARWTAARCELEAAQEAANEKLSELEADVNEKISAMNTIIEEAQELRQEIETDMTSYFDERSEKWQESDKGSAYGDWQSSWAEDPDVVEEVSIEPVAVVEDTPEELMPEDSYPSEPSN